MLANIFKKRIILLLVPVIASLIVVTIYVKSRVPKPTSPIPGAGQTESRPEQSDGGDEDSDQNEPVTTPKPGALPPPGSPGATNPSPAPSSASSKKPVIPLLSALAYDDTAQKVIATGFAEGQFNATCTITFEKAGYSSVVRNGPTELQSNRSACPRFEIPRSDFPASGDWTARLQIHSSSVEGTSEPGLVTITND